MLGFRGPQENLSPRTILLPLLRRWTMVKHSASNVWVFCLCSHRGMNVSNFFRLFFQDKGCFFLFFFDIWRRKSFTFSCWICALNPYFAQIGKNLLDVAKNCINVKSYSNVAEHNRNRPTYRPKLIPWRMPDVWPLCCLNQSSHGYFTNSETPIWKIIFNSSWRNSCYLNCYIGFFHFYLAMSEG